MRAFAGGYYENLMRMYDHLGVRYRTQPFIFSFARLDDSSRKGTGKALPYMTHASNFHQIPPRPAVGALWFLEVVYVLVFYLWFSICCLLLPPREESESRFCESLEDYLRRICLPWYFSENYLLPLMCSVSTCSHGQLLQFPAQDIIEYKKRTRSQEHYVVDGGVQTVEDRLAEGLDVRLGTSCTEVEARSEGVQIRSVDYRGRESIELFDMAVLAVSPDVAAKVFRPLKSLARVPLTAVQSVAHTDADTVTSLPNLHSKISSRHAVQNIHLRSMNGETEAVHEVDSSVIVTTSPLTNIRPSSIMRVSWFPRVLRTSESRNIVKSIFSDASSRLPSQGGQRLMESAKSWRNGDDGVFLVGGWCWDGMVLLEGCVVSAMRVARMLDVTVPWSSHTISRN